MIFIDYRSCTLFIYGSHFSFLTSCSAACKLLKCINVTSWYAIHLMYSDVCQHCAGTIQTPGVCSLSCSLEQASDCCTLVLSILNVSLNILYLPDGGQAALDANGNSQHHAERKAFYLTTWL